MAAFFLGSQRTNAIMHETILKALGGRVPACACGHDYTDCPEDWLPSRLGRGRTPRGPAGRTHASSGFLMLCLWCFACPQKGGCYRNPEAGLSRRLLCSIQVSSCRLTVQGPDTGRAGASLSSCPDPALAPTFSSGDT